MMISEISPVQSPQARRSLKANEDMKKTTMSRLLVADHFEYMASPPKLKNKQTQNAPLSPKTFVVPTAYMSLDNASITRYS
jgi:hypothetical protein